MLKNFDKKELQDLEHQFANATPFKHLIIDNFLNEDLAISLANNFPPITAMATSYNGLNERKAEHSDFSKLVDEFELLKTQFFYTEFVKSIEQITGIENLKLIDDRFGFGLHQGGANSFLDVHIDYNLHPTERKQRRLNLILFLNLEWREGWGGMLQLWNNDATKCEVAILPQFNRCVIFECSETSFHGYDRILCPKEITRKSVYTYFFTEPEAKLKFHDTIFKPKPNDSIAKKLIVPIKEFTKNAIKRFLYNAGVKRVWKK